LLNRIVDGVGAVNRFAIGSGFSVQPILL